MSAIATRAHNVMGMGDVTVGDDIRQRRIRAGFSVKALAERAGVDRGTLAAIEEGVSSARPTSIAAVLAALDAFEEETGGPYDEAVPESRHVTFRLSGNFGIEVTVEGPVESLPELEASVERLIAKMERRRPD